jgi:hypothetical protein
MVYEYSKLHIASHFILLIVNTNTHCERVEILEELKANTLKKLRELMEIIPFPLTTRNGILSNISKDTRRDGAIYFAQLVQYKISDVLAEQLLSEAFCTNSEEI